MNLLSTKQLIEQLKEHHPIDFHFMMNKSPKVIMITGANGFLAQHLLSQLCLLPEVETIYCLVRNLSKFSFYHAKIQPVQYDGEESFHINRHEIDSYLKQTDCFIHCAAEVHNLKKLSSLYNANVAFSYHILNKIKHLNLSLSFHLISTLSVYASSSNGVTQYTNDNINKENAYNQLLPINEQHQIIGGYAQSKWLSEYIFSKTNAHIIRLGLLTPDFHNPKLKDDEFLTMLIKLIIKVGSIPFETDVEYYQSSRNTLVDITPVDFAAKFITEMISSRYQFTYKKETSPYISHMANHISMSLFQMTNIIQEHYNIKLFNCRKSEWLESLEKLELGSLEKKLLMQTFFRDELLSNDFKYFNIDLFQSSLYDWSQCNKSGDMPTSSNIFHEYLKDYHV